MSFALCHAAGDMFMPTERRRHVYTTALAHGDVVTFTEAQKDHAFIKARPGVSSALLAELAIAWKRNKFTLVDHGGRLVMVGGRRGSGKKGDHRRRGPNRYFLWVVLREDATGKDTLLGLHHGPAKPDTSQPWRKALANQAIANSAAELRRAMKKHPDATVIVDGDWNRKGIVDWKAGLNEARTPATFGKHLRYDRIQHGPTARVTGIKAIVTGGDHRGLVATVTPQGRVISTPVPAPPVGDGVTDDTAAIQAAITAAGHGGVVKPKPPVAPPVSLHTRAAANAKHQSEHGPSFGTGECLMRVRGCYDIDAHDFTPRSGRVPLAIEAFDFAKFQHRESDPAKIPATAPFVFWRGGSTGAGHIAIPEPTKPGWCWSTDIKRNGRFDLVKIADVAKIWPKLTLVGWTEDLNLKRVVVFTTTPQPAPVPAKNRRFDLTGFVPRIDGVDVSHFQDPDRIDWAKAKNAGVKFVWAKCTESLTFIDPTYAEHRARAGKAGLKFGAYHFARPGESTGLQQARFLLAHAGVAPADLRVMLDLEDRSGLSDEALTRWVEAFVAEVKKQTGKPPVVYTRFTLTRNVDCFLWVARYNDDNRLPVIPKPWTRWAIWQFSNGVDGIPHNVPGFPGHVDIDTLPPGFDLKRLQLVPTARKKAAA